MESSCFYNNFGIIGAIVGAKNCINFRYTQNLKKMFWNFLCIIAIYEIIDLIKWYKKFKKLLIIKI